MASTHQVAGSTPAGGAQDFEQRVCWTRLDGARIRTARSNGNSDQGTPERLGVENLYHVAMWVVVGGDIVRPEPFSAAFTAASTAAMRSVVSRSNYSSEMEDGGIARVR